MKQEVLNFIKNNLPKTIVKDNKDVPYPYNSPGLGSFYDFFYWDLYFINKCLLLHDMDEQAENNIKNMVYFVKELGYIPNSNFGDMRKRTQPPVFPLCVWDLYQYRKDKKVIKDYIDYIIKEHEFFQKRRMTPIGLNAFMCDDETNSYEDIMNHYRILSCRVYEYSDDPKMKYQIGRDIIAIAESGLDFNPRFRTPNRLVAAHEFAHLDLNCWLYIDEIRISKMLRIVKRDEEADQFEELAKKRKQLVDKYFLDEDGIYKDYHLSDGKHSEIITAANIYPYAMGISKDKDGCLKILKDLELECGVATAKYRGDDEYYQWDYPVMWGETTFIIYNALLNVGAFDEAKRIIDKYMAAIEKQFKITNKLWEKYDARTGSTIDVEYESQPFMGWTAASYKIFSTEGINVTKPYIKISD